MLEKIDADKLWVNPDCGLKTRGEKETLASLYNLVKAAKELREIYSDLQKEETAVEEREKAERIADLKAKRKAMEEEAIAAGHGKVAIKDYII